MSSTMAKGSSPALAVTVVRSPPARVLVVGVVVRDATAGRYAPREALRQVRVVAGTERAALSLEVGVAAEHPVAALHAQRTRLVVESDVVQAAHPVAVDGDRAAAEAGTGVEDHP